MAAGINDKFKKTFNSDNPNVTFVTTTRSGGSTTLICDSLAGWPTSTAVDFITYQLDTDGETVVAGSQRDWKGIVSSNTITNLTLIAGGSDAGSSVNDIVEMTPTGNWANDLISGILVGHDQDGSHKAKAIGLSEMNGGSTAGILHTDSSGNVSSSDVVASDIDFTTFPTSVSTSPSGSISSTTYANYGSTVGVVAPTGGCKALVILSGVFWSSGDTTISFNVSGATTIATADSNGMRNGLNGANTQSMTTLVSLNAGTNTFQVQAKTTVTMTPVVCRITVIPLPW